MSGTTRAPRGGGAAAGSPRGPDRLGTNRSGERHESPARRRPPLTPGRRLVDRGLAWITGGAALSVFLLLLVIVAVLIVPAMPSIREFGAGFLISDDWRPNELEVPVRDSDGNTIFADGEMVTETIPASFGALPVLWGTAASSLLALLFAVPIGIGTALVLARVWRSRASTVLSFLIEFLAAIPSIAYGMWGLMVLAPILQDHAEPALRSLLDVPGLSWMFRETLIVGGQAIERELPLAGRDLLCGGLVLGIMILPILTAIARDVLRAVPREQIEGSLALGATWWQSSWAMLRYSRSGLLGAVLLGLARAAGETMAVTMVIGNHNQIRASPFAPAQTMSSLLANEFAEATSELHRAALIEVALVLLVSLLAVNVVARWLVVGRGVARMA